ncbi:hypothetical protein [Miniphocaeibacter halophilus]|uniref:Uncharacterized protein n=1 Tax=Miniphocaeibacter halophilus TaxID=2931922 RepID=A0AC61MT25_9FIRM|nr:hypothetical protein [Miniphocaeibacter halophilus]QQK07361.1 hypothetical protein JFY71_08550 [Miniphocaeibacter halophilus]
MLLLENKYDLFKKITYDKKLSFFNKELDEYEKALAKDLADYEKELKNKFEKKLKKEKHRLDIKKNEELEIIKNLEKESILKLREQLIDEISINLEEKYRGYIKTEKYFENLKIGLKEFLDDNNNTIFLLKDDINRFNSSSKRFKVLDESEIGGFIVLNEKENIIYNNSIKEKIKGNRNTIGLYIQEFINKVGEEIE